jgi:hypothetical protein
MPRATSSRKLGRGPEVARDPARGRRPGTGPTTAVHTARPRRRAGSVVAEHGRGTELTIGRDSLAVTRRPRAGAGSAAATADLASASTLALRALSPGPECEPGREREREPASGRTTTRDMSAPLERAGGVTAGARPSRRVAPAPARELGLVTGRETTRATCAPRSSAGGARRRGGRRASRRLAAVIRGCATSRSTAT